MFWVSKEPEVPQGGWEKMKFRKKHDFPVSEVRRFLEPGPTIMVTSAWKGERNVMTMNWHTLLEFTPSLVGLMIAPGDYSHDLIRKSKECVINVPEAWMMNKVIAAGNTTGAETDKFKDLDLATTKAKKVKAPLLRECFANFECKVVEFIPRYSLFICKVVKAHVASSPKYPQTMHYRGEGVFMISGKNIRRARQFRPENL